MKRVFFFTLILGANLFVNAQEGEYLLENYRIYLNSEGKSSNSQLPFFLELKNHDTTAKYYYKNIPIIEKQLNYEVIDSHFSFKSLGKNFNYSSIIVDLIPIDNKVIIKPQEDVKDLFETKFSDEKHRVTLNTKNGVVFKKEGLKVSAITIPIKIYLHNKSDSLANFSNNIVTDLSLGLTYGKSKENYLFKGTNKPELKFSNYKFVFINFSKLELNKKNTDGKHDGDSILNIGLGIGYQLGYGKFSLGLTGGVDLPTSSIGQNWVFRYEPWLGFGIGYSVFD